MTGAGGVTDTGAQRTVGELLGLRRALLRGIEGEGARGYFAAINLVVKPQARGSFALDGRTRRPRA